ncbi:hypothetical protein BZA05DRAFT_222646 [Tricharina praecox]|uniref:uncharacterized protein n=1 Tax=Tricharina praecox TaxID=43433 RepID=UPI002220950E|nr:uncharacterized protein BZA05DRAFT_222646 [Tricharina praecox]KAI5855967.1 hypothetical protein BZA05DRAFT_222646 [Tricharina praecox]
MTSFQNQVLDPSFDLSSVVQNPRTAPTARPDSAIHTFSPFTSPSSSPPSSRPQSSYISLWQPPIRRVSLPPGASSLPLGARISDQFPKPPSRKEKQPAPAALDLSAKLPEGYPVLDSPTLPSPEAFVEREEYSNRLHRLDHDPSHLWTVRTPQHGNIRQQLSSLRAYPRSPVPPNHARFISESSLNIYPRRIDHLVTIHTRSASASAYNSMAPIQPNISLPEEGFAFVEDSTKPKSPNNRFTSLFRWGSTSEQGAGSVDPMPALSPTSTSHRGSLLTASKAPPPAIDTSRANASQLNTYSDTESLYPPGTPGYGSFDAIEDEVRAVSADLAASIRREMDLEDLVERLQSEAANNGRRTSDYYSDAGTPARYVDSEGKDMDAERMVRKVEQEKAQLRLDMLEKVQEEREKRRTVEAQVKELEDLVSKTSTGSHLAPPDVPARIKDLEMSLEEAKRKLVEERQLKENFEDLLTALKEELEANRNDRDNLRDEVVPQLRARVEGLEAETLDLQKLMYEHTFMQQELASLKTENVSLAQVIQEKTQAQLESQANFKHQIEAQVEYQVQQARAHSQVQPPAIQAQVVQAQLVQIQTNSHVRHSMSGAPSGYATPGTPTSAQPPTLPLNPKDRESLAERLKDVENQRDALRKGLLRLRDRQQLEAKKSKERIKTLEMERDRALDPNIKRQGRDKEVSALRREIDRLRQRADEALEQKFVCERSLGTLMMDLEKAEQETSTLRVLLQEHDDLAAEHGELQDSHERLSREVSELKQAGATPASPSLKQAYHNLQNLHERLLARLGELETRDTDPAFVTEREQTLEGANEASQRAIQELRKSLTSAEVERDTAQVEAEAYRKRAESLQKSEKMHMQEERNLAAQLRISSERVEELAAQVRAQLASNETLRERLADCITRGEEEQSASAKKINSLQGKLRSLEDKVAEAQQQAEEAVSQHEDEIRRIKETHTSQLRRLKSSALASPGLKPQLSPLLRSPKLEWTSVRRLSSSDSNKTELLEKRVGELEKALEDADDEMSEVVARMAAAQIEVMNLQTERDEAVRQAKRLGNEYLIMQAKYADMP